MTDFGEEDGYVGIMKGVIYRIAPQSNVIDLSHGVAPQDLLGGALTLQRAVPYFAPQTVFVCVVDPGVGTQRRSIAARFNDKYYVGPDNGLITLWLDDAEKAGSEVEIVHLDQPQYWLESLSSSFHGRDVYAPTGAHLAAGVPLNQLGTPINDPVCLDVPMPRPTNRGWTGRIIHIDHFGNLATNIERSHLIAFMEEGERGISRVKIKYGEYTIHGISATFGDEKPGSVVAIIDSADRLSIAVVNGNAQEYLDAEIGDTINVIRK